jgi:hypothetical protein
VTAHTQNTNSRTGIAKIAKTIRVAKAPPMLRDSERVGEPAIVLGDDSASVDANFLAFVPCLD